MNMTVTFDSSAWIEYFAGTKLGLKVKDIVDREEFIYTPSIGLLEIKHKYQRENSFAHSYLTSILISVPNSEIRLVPLLSSYC